MGCSEAGLGSCFTMSLSGKVYGTLKALRDHGSLNQCADYFAVLLCLFQVLCKEGLLGHRGYWEVDYDGWVVIGVVSESAPRKGHEVPCGLGENSSSWGVGPSGSYYQVWHNGENTDVQMPSSSTMGIYVDQPAGIIKFLSVEGEAEEEVRLIHKFKAKLGEKVFPGFWIGTNSFCLLRKTRAGTQEN